MAETDNAAKDDLRTVVQLLLEFSFVDIPVTLETSISDSGDWVFTGEATPDLSLADFLTKLEKQENTDPEKPWDKAAMPEGTDVSLGRTGLTYRTDRNLFSVHSAIDVKVKNGPKFDLDLAFARLSTAVPGGQAETAAASTVLVGLRSRGRIDLTSVLGKEAGFVGQFLGGLHLDRLGVYYASDQIDAIDGSLFGSGDDAPLSFGKGPSFSARFGSAESHTDIVLPPLSEGKKATAPSPETAAPNPGLEAATEPETGAPMRYWKDLDKTIGPLQFRRVGGEWHEGKIGLLMDASVSLLGLNVGLAGLAVRVPPSKLTSLEFEDLEFGLDGLNLSFVRGPVAISGALLKTRDGDKIGYAGQASIRAETFAIAAIGAYSTTDDGQPAFFIFGAYTGILGGPPCFVVEGIAAGFGYNRAITLPEIDAVRDFPLVSIVCGASEKGSSDTLAQLRSEENFPAMAGQYWIAAGVKFTSFKLVETFALITVAFGTRFEIALLGIATMRQPPAPVVPTLVYVEMALKVRFAPDDGQLLVAAQLTSSSYLFDPRCKLTGGFAFCIWFKPTNPKFDDHSGDFVVTLGGYHPRFQVPAHYPSVPRVGFNWMLPECGVTIKGEAYFALTPSFIMTGARFSAVFRSGDFSAWFEVHADFLIGWAPLHYEAEVGVRIGAAFVLRIGSLAATFSFELQALLRIWGPPFAGEAYVDLGIVAFTVPLGDRNAPREVPKLDWKGFKSQFLPAKPLGISIVAGLIEEHEGDTPYIVVNPSELCVAVETFVPITGASHWKENGMQARDLTRDMGYARELGIRPMGARKLTSSLQAAFEGMPMASGMVFSGILKSGPEALWSDEPMPDARTTAVLATNTIKDTLMGFQVRPASCHEFAAEEVAIKIRSQPKVDLAAASRAPEDNAPYVQPQHRRQWFLDAWRTPDEAVIKAIRDAGFDLPRDPVDLADVDAAIGAPRHTRPPVSPRIDPQDELETEVEDTDPAILWLAAPQLVPINKLPQAQA